MRSTFREEYRISALYKPNVLIRGLSLLLLALATVLLELGSLDTRDNLRLQGGPVGICLAGQSTDGATFYRHAVQPSGDMEILQRLTLSIEVRMQSLRRELPNATAVVRLRTG